MAWPVCNSTVERDKLSEIPILYHWTFHRVGLWVSGVCSVVALVISLFLIAQHATHYLKPWEQKHIIRILLMVPVYAAVSFLSIYNYTHSVYFEVVRDCYEAFAIASFFSLMCHYIAPTLHEQKDYFRGIRPRGWVWPVPWMQNCCGGKNGVWRTPRSGLTWFNVIWSGVFQYCFIRVFMTCVAVITEAVNLYCLESLNPAFAHVWVMVIEAAAVTIAMYCIIQFYLQIKDDIVQHKPLLKVLAIKLVIFLSFWQSLIISFLTSAKALKQTKTIGMPDIKFGIPSMLLCIEMALFAIFHIWAFSYRPYVLPKGKAYLHHGDNINPTGSGTLHYQGGFLGSRAILDALNVWDMIKAFGRGVRWLVSGRRSRENDSSYSVSRVPTNMDAFPNGPPTEIDPLKQTSYTGAGGGASPKPIYPGATGIGEENLGLMTHAQGIGVAPRRQAEYAGGDMGTRLTMNTKEYDDITDGRWSDPNTGRYAGPGQVLGEQESGVVGVDTRYDGSGSRREHVPYSDPPPFPQGGRGRGR